MGCLQVMQACFWEVRVFARMLLIVLILVILMPLPNLSWCSQFLSTKNAEYLILKLVLVASITWGGQSCKVCSNLSKLAGNITLSCRFCGDGLSQRSVCCVSYTLAGDHNTKSLSYHQWISSSNQIRNTIIFHCTTYKNMSRKSIILKGGDRSL